MDNHINNRDLCYEGKHTFENVANNFEVSEDTYQELRGKNLEKIKEYHDKVMEDLSQSITEYKTNASGGDGYILVNKINPTVKHLNTINLKIINMLEETMSSVEEIELDMQDTKEQKAEFETKLNDINIAIEEAEKRIEDLSQTLKSKSIITDKLEDRNKIFFIINSVILGIVLLGCLYIIFRGNKSKSKKMEFGLTRRQPIQLEQKGPTLTKDEKQSKENILSKMFNQSNKNTEMKMKKDAKMTKDMMMNTDKTSKPKKGLFSFLSRKKEEPTLNRQSPLTKPPTTVKPTSITNSK